VDLEWGDDEACDDLIEDDVVNSEEDSNENVGMVNGEPNSVSSNASTEASNASTEENLNTERRRIQRAPAYLNDYVTGEGFSDEDIEVNMAQIVSADPSSFEEAKKSSKWRLAMDAEMQAIERNETWQLTELPVGAKKIGVKWIYKTKFNELGEVDKYKARLVAKGYSQQQGVDYTEVYAPVARMDTVRMIIALAAQRGWKIFQLDVKSAFLHGELSEDVYVEQPMGYVQKGNEYKVYILQKALYGLKQAPRAWFSIIEAHFVSEGFQRCHSEQTLFVKTSNKGTILIVSIYVDNLIYTGDDDVMMSKFKESMLREFDMSDLGGMRFFLGIEVLQTANGIYICQRKYALDVLKRFGMEDSNVVCSPIVPGSKLHNDEGGVKVNETYFKQIVGSLMYLTTTRPDIMFIVSLISRYMSKPTELHLQAAKRTLRYLKGTVSYEILYKKGEVEELLAFTDSDYVGDVEDRKITSGYVFLMNSGAVSWSSRKQPLVTLSTTEAEFVAAANCACQTV
jgi:hypothetical protein